MLSMKDVAKGAGVSVATVSNVITGKRVVSDKMRDKVLAEIKSLNYQVNLVARGLKTRRTFTIGVVLPDVTKLFFLDVLKGIMDIAYKNGYRISILSSSYDFATEMANINALKSSRVDGIILDSCAAMDNYRAWAEEMLNDPINSPPVVSLENRLHPDLISSILIDNEQYSMSITQHLIDSGKRDIFFISGPVHLEHEYARLTGYRKALLHNGIPLRSEMEAGGDYLSGTGYNAVKSAYDAGIRFDAVQASSDQAAIGALKALNEMGIKVPEDTAVCGFDNLFTGTLVTPAITTVDVPRYEMGVTAMDALLRLIDDKSAKPECQYLRAYTIIRASSKKEVESQWDLENW